LVALDHATACGRDMVEDEIRPRCALLYVVQSLIAGSNELVDVVYVSNFIVLAPVVSELHFCLFRVSVRPIASPADNKRHVSAVLAIQPE